MYLGIDVGTSGIKLVLIDDEQHIHAETVVPLSVDQPAPLRSEQQPEHWFNAITQGIAALRQAQPQAIDAIVAIGLTGQMHGAVCLDKTGEVLHPAILWNDGRSHQECQDLMAICPAFESVGANTVMPGFTAPKLLWLQRHRPNIFRKIAKVLLPKDYIRYLLTGDYATDLSDASGTLWLDVAKRCWSTHLLHACDLSTDHMPFILEGPEFSGQLSNTIARQLNLPAGIQVVAGASDNAAGALSMGIFKPGNGMISLGTSGVYFAPITAPDSSPKKGLHTFCHALPERWHQMGVILSAASALHWWKQVVGVTSEQQLVAQAKQADANQVPIFLPYLSGERTPHNDPFAKGSFIGMRHRTTTAEMTQAVLEGVAFALSDCQQVMSETGTEIDRLSVIGGGAKSPYWGRILANVLNKSLCYHAETAIGPAFGAARLALLAGNDLPIDTVLSQPKVTLHIQPNPDAVHFYYDRYQQYQQAYQKLKTFFKE